MIDDLMRDTSIERMKIGEHSYAIRVLGRGDMLFFQEDEKALICEVDAANAVIFAKSIKNWNNTKKMPADERKRVVELVFELYRRCINNNVVVV